MTSVLQRLLGHELEDRGQRRHTNCELAFTYVNTIYYVHKTTLQYYSHRSLQNTILFLCLKFMY